MNLESITILTALADEHNVDTLSIEFLQNVHNVLDVLQTEGSSVESEMFFLFISSITTPPESSPATRVKLRIRKSIEPNYYYEIHTSIEKIK